MEDAKLLTAIEIYENHPINVKIDQNINAKKAVRLLFSGLIGTALQLGMIDEADTLAEAAEKMLDRKGKLT